MQVWRINIKTQELTCEPVPEDWNQLGGRGLIAKICLDEIPPDCDPLGAKNKLIFAPGILTGYMLSSCDRLSVGGKSPLTGGVKESNAGGSTGNHLARSGIKALILEDLPSDRQWKMICVEADGIRFLPADDLAGKGVHETARILRQQFGNDAAISMIGPGGENQLLAAGIVNLDKDGFPSRINARGGMGAVMGSKHIKAIVFTNKSKKRLPVFDSLGFKTIQKNLNKAQSEHPQLKTYREFGTDVLVMVSNARGAIPTRNFSRGSYENAEAISGEALRDTMLARGKPSNPVHACMTGCVIACSNILGDDKGNVVISPLEYETVGLLGSNLEIADLDALAKLNWEVNDLGLDSIDIGAALGVAAEAGLMQFGDSNRAFELLNEIRKNTPVGRIIGNGAGLTGRILGIRRVPVVKNQAISAYDPRAIKGTGVTYATTPQGADHTCGLTIYAKLDQTKPEGQVDVSRKAQMNMAGFDTLGACIFSGYGFGSVPQAVPGLLKACFNWQAEANILQELGRKTIELEREFNRRAGFTPADDRLPEWMCEEPLPPNNTVFDVQAEELDQIFNW